ncbi:hypothetical protein PV04_03837 [Phialophora macrospora]|uniref:Uncharacterized protein n=1 Tax=Phialophora macrospora TaxID=1851006 RepID=A0A0D2EBM9_9EURO|nr:hypothetical protein PV04_03837 [Phialophora macrospora]
MIMMRCWESTASCLRGRNVPRLGLSLSPIGEAWNMGANETGVIRRADPELCHSYTMGSTASNDCSSHPRVNKENSLQLLPILFRRPPASSLGPVAQYYRCSVASRPRPQHLPVKKHASCPMSVILPDHRHPPPRTTAS